MNEQDLLRLKKRVDDVKTEVSEHTGHKQALLKQLKDDYGCKSVEEAEAKISKMNKEISNLDAEIEKGISEIEEKYEI